MVFTGLDALQGFFNGSLTGWFTLGTYTFILEVTRLAGEVAYIAWHVSCAPGEVTPGIATFVVREGTRSPAGAMALAGHDHAAERC